MSERHPAYQRAGPGLNQVLVLLDASQSAAPGWPQVAMAARSVLQALPRETTCETYLLGCPKPMPMSLLMGDSPAFPASRARHCSLIAPHIQAALRRRQPVNVIVIGSGPIFDLADWAAEPLVCSWFFLRTDAESLLPDGVRLPEYPLDNWETMVNDLLHTVPAVPPRRRPESWWCGAQYEWLLDPAGFPMLLVEPLDAYVHLFPVAKPQFEHYIWSVNPPQWDDDHYRELLTLNPRPSADQTIGQARERLFLTGILPPEVDEFTAWLGPDYQPLSTREWCEVGLWLRRRDVTAPSPELTEAGLSPVALRIWRSVLDELRPPDMLALSFMLGGVIEWVTDAAASPGAPVSLGLGQPDSTLFASLRRPVDPVRPIDVSRRMRHFGFRLKRRML